MIFHRQVTMIDDISDISAFYNGNPQGEHERLERHQLEYDLTWRYLKKYLPTRGSILEVGAATGRYTLDLARKGYQVTAVDISLNLLEFNHQAAAAAKLLKKIRYVHADARQLPDKVGDDFHAALLMGPLYHLVHELDRILALQQAHARLRPGGIIVTTFVSRFGLFSDLLKTMPEWITERKEVQSVLAIGRDPEDYPRGGFRGYFATPTELAPLHESFGFETLVVAASEPIIGADDESYNKLTGRQRRLWLDQLFEMSTEPSIIGASRHLLYIGRKV
jgi:S-adenosylmethionine-dependent methyltransferase